MSVEKGKQIRLFIGAISHELYIEKEQLVSRLSKFGTVLSDLEIHQKPTSLTYFAYLNIEITDKNLVKLKQHLNGVNFKNSKLIIDILSKTFKEKWEEDQKRPDTKEEDRLKREKIASRRLERIADGDNQLVVRGRIRKTARKNLKNLTLRCYLNGKLLSIPKNNKTKVWGYDKNKKLRDLTWIFENQAWKDGNLHIVEKSTVVSQRLSKGDTSENEEEEEEVFEIEKSTNTKILGELFQNFDFDKPIELKEQEKEEESGESDYEFELNFSVRDSYDIKQKDCNNESAKLLEEYKKSNPVVEDKIEEDDIEEDEEEQDDVEEENNDEEDARKQDDVEKEQEEEQDSDVDGEFIPTFGKPVPEPVEEEKVNDTENLRHLFNPTATTSFKLQEDSDIDDVDNEIDEVEKQEILKEQELKKQVLNASTNKSLFFQHQDSPFLLTQSQLNKISSTFEFDKEEFETWFYEKRGELNREFKRYKRDFVRQFNKKK